MGVVVNLNEAEDMFEEFWNLYPSPRRTGKAICKTKWKHITNGGLTTRTLDKDSGTYIELHNLQATPEDIIAGLKRACDKWRGTTGTEKYGWKDGGKFIPNPSTWLNRGSWED